MGLAVIEPVLKCLCLLKSLLRILDLFLVFALDLTLMDVELGGKDALKSLPLLLHQLLIVGVHEKELFLRNVRRERRLSS